MGVFQSSQYFSVSRARYFMRYAILLALMLVSAQDAVSQWTKLTTAGLGNNVSNLLGETGAMAFRDGKLWFGRDKLYYSTDTGKTWKIDLSFPSLQPGYHWNAVADIDFSDAMHGIIADTLGVFQTDDGGQTWQSVIGAGQGFSSVLLDSINAGMFVGASGAAERTSLDSSWQISPKNALLCLRTNHDRTKCYYMVDTFAQTGHNFQTVDVIWITTDRGQTWRLRAPSPPQPARR